MAVTYIGNVARMEAGDTLAGIKRVREIRATANAVGGPQVAVRIGGSGGPVLGKEISVDWAADETITIAGPYSEGQDFKNLYVETATQVADLLVILA